MHTTPLPKDLPDKIEDISRSSPEWTIGRARRLMRWLAKHLSRWSEDYYNTDSPAVDDATYDKCYAINAKLEEEFTDCLSPLSTSLSIGAQLPVGTAKIIHMKPMLSLDTLPDDLAVHDFRVKAEAIAGEDVEFTAEFKVDGVSLSLTYIDGELFSGATRGDGTAGEDVTRNLPHISGIPEYLPDSPDRLEVRGEVYMRKCDFLDLNHAQLVDGEKPFTNPRNAAAGSLRHTDPAIVATRKLFFTPHTLGGISDADYFSSQVVFLEYCFERGFHILPYGICHSLENMLQYHLDAHSSRAMMNIDIDGVVYKVNQGIFQEMMGETARAPRWAKAYKFPAKYAYTKLQNIIIQVAASGTLTPVAILAPVNIGGVLVSRASLYNEDNISRKDIRIGDVVKVVRAGDVIPKIIEVDLENSPKDRQPFVFPDRCPICGHPAVREVSKSIRKCTGGVHCSAQHNSSTEEIN